MKPGSFDTNLGSILFWGALRWEAVLVWEHLCRNTKLPEHKFQRRTKNRIYCEAHTLRKTLKSGDTAAACLRSWGRLKALLARSCLNIQQSFISFGTSQLSPRITFSLCRRVEIQKASQRPQGLTLSCFGGGGFQFELKKLIFCWTAISNATVEAFLFVLVCRFRGYSSICRLCWTTNQWFIF